MRVVKNIHNKIEINNIYLVASLYIYIINNE